jgi:putative tricarboxylic transport membrane protein
MLAVRGLRRSEGKPQGGVRGLALDFVTGFLIAGPAFWLFTQLLGINLPGVTGTGWL